MHDEPFDGPTKEQVQTLADTKGVSFATMARDLVAYANYRGWANQARLLAGWAEGGELMPNEKSWRSNA